MNQPANEFPSDGAGWPAGWRNLAGLWHCSLDLQLAHFLRNSHTALDRLFGGNEEGRRKFLVYLNDNLVRYSGFHIDDRAAGNRALFEAGLQDFQNRYFRAAWPWPDDRYDAAMAQVSTSVGQTGAGWFVWNWGDNLDGALRSLVADQFKGSPMAAPLTERTSERISFPFTWR